MDASKIAKKKKKQADNRRMLSILKRRVGSLVSMESKELHSLTTSLFVVIVKESKSLDLVNPSKAFRGLLRNVLGFLLNVTKEEASSYLCSPFIGLMDRVQHPRKYWKKPRLV
jgi:hypothetical protein